METSVPSPCGSSVLFYTGKGCTMMNQFHAFCHLFRRHLDLLFFSLAICCGFTAGTAWAISGGSEYYAIIRRAVYGSAYFHGLLISCVLPFLCVVVILNFADKRLVYPIAFAKFFLLSATATGISGAFGSAAWLVRCFFQFSDICTVPIFILYTVHYLMKKKVSRKATILALGWYLLVIMLDYFICSPYWVNRIVN